MAEDLSTLFQNPDLSMEDKSKILADMVRRSKAGEDVSGSMLRTTAKPGIVPDDRPDLMGTSAPLFGGQGALSKAAAEVVPPQAVERPAPQVAPAQGALTQTARAEPDFAAMLNKFVPQDDSMERYLAMSAAFTRPNVTGSFGETMSNVSNALLEQKQNQAKLRAQYTPLILQQVAAQQARDENHLFQAQQAAQAQQQHTQNMQMQIAAQAENARLQRENTAAIAGANQGLRQDANNTARAHMMAQALSQYPYGIPQGVLDQINATLGSGAGPTGGNPSTNTAPMGPGSKTDGLSGDEFLAALPPSLARSVKAMAEGREPIPSGRTATTPTGVALMSALGQYDPQFDAVNYGARMATRKDFTAGKSAQALTAFNTTLGHISDLQEAAAKLNNAGGFPGATLFNAAGNAITNSGTGTAVKDFNTAKDAVVGELVKAFNNGQVSDSQLHEWASNLSSSDTPEQINAVIKRLTSLLGSKIGSMSEQYKNGMGTTSEPLKMLTPHAAETYTKIIGQRPSWMDMVPGGDKSAPATADSVQALIDKHRSK